MNNDQYTSESRPGECKPLMDACTPLIYRHNAFRITGLFADASVRDIKRRIDDLKHAEEMGDAEEEHSHAFALNPPPGLENIREAALRLQDPERRIVEEFFWFWPMEWGNWKHDPALLALANGDKKIPFEIWTKALSDEQSERSIVSKHNLAVMYQITALDDELSGFDKNLTEESISKIDQYWKKCFEWWEELAEDEVFWSLVSNRIRMLDDPRLTTGFARRMRATLPESLDKINALMAMEYIEKGKLELARKHIVYMKETLQGLDDTEKTLADVTRPLNVRLEASIEHAKGIASQTPSSADTAAMEFLNTACNIINILEVVYSPDAHQFLDACDSIVDVCITCAMNHAHETETWGACLSILESARQFARTADTSAELSEVQIQAKARSELSHPKVKSLLNLLKNLDGMKHLDKIKAIYNGAPYLLFEIEREFGKSSKTYEFCSDAVAGELRNISVGLHNQVDPSDPLDRRITILALSLFVHDKASSLACGQEIKERFRDDESVLCDFRSSLLTKPHQLFMMIAAGLLPKWGDAKVSPPPLPVVRKETSNKGWVVAIAIAVFLFIVYIVSKNDSSNTRAPRQSQPQSSYGTRSSPRNTLATEIENGKAQAKQMESQIKKMDDRLEEMERQMNLYSNSGRTDEYNRLVPSFNALVNEQKANYKEYSRLVDEVNSKVNRYNSGNR